MSDGWTFFNYNIPTLHFKAGTPSGQVTSAALEGGAAVLQLYAGNVTTTVGMRPEVNLAVAVAPAARVESAVVLAEIGPTKSKWHL